jgi:hypothetical protein
LTIVASIAAPQVNSKPVAEDATLEADDKAIEPKIGDVIYDLEPAEDKLEKIQNRMTKLYYKCLKHGGCGANNLAGWYGGGLGSYSLLNSGLYGSGLGGYPLGLGYGWGSSGLYDGGFGSYGLLNSGIYGAGLGGYSALGSGLYGGGLYGGGLPDFAGSYGNYGGFPTYGNLGGGLGLPSAGYGAGVGPTFYSGDTADTDAITVYAADRK